MAITRLSNSGIKTGVLKYDSALAGYPPVMAAPTATDAGTGTSVNVAFTAVSGATSYTALSSPGSFTATGASSPLTVTGLSSGTAYTFQVRATNAVGTGPYSAASNSVTPVVPTAFDSIATLEGDGSTSSVTFTSIPQTYQHLQIRINGRLTSSTSTTNTRIRINGDTGASYTNQWVLSSPNGGINVQQDSLNTFIYGNRALMGGVTPSTQYACAIIDILNYSTTVNNKTLRMLSGAMVPTDSDQTALMLGTGMQLSTSAISSITLISDTGGTYNFATGTSIALYGIRG